jgi:hypothetical protein
MASLAHALPSPWPAQPVFIPANGQPNVLPNHPTGMPFMAIPSNVKLRT